MTSRERLLATFRNEPTDRVPVRLWGVNHLVEPGRQVDRPLWEIARRYGIDIMQSWGPREGTGHFLSASDKVSVRSFQRPSDHDGFVEDVTVVSTPAGELTGVHLRNLEGKPGYQIKHLIETLDDAKKWLSIPTAPVKPPTDTFFEEDRELGDNGALMAGIGHAMYGVNTHTGSQVWAEWSVLERGLLFEMVDVMYERLEAYVKHLLAAGVGPIFGYVGPELCVPPLQSPRDFSEFVTAYDRRIIALIHDAGGLVWVHCHGKVNAVFDDFVEMGVNCLNPIEPPPMGDITLAEAKRRSAGRMALEGNVEVGLFQTAAPEEMEAEVEAAMREGKPGGGFILSPTSDHSHWIAFDDRILKNYEVLIQTGLRLGRYE